MPRLLTPQTSILHTSLPRLPIHRHCPFGHEPQTRSRIQAIRRTKRFGQAETTPHRQCSDPSNKTFLGSDQTKDCRYCIRSDPACSHKEMASSSALHKLPPIRSPNKDVSPALGITLKNHTNPPSQEDALPPCWDIHICQYNTAADASPSCIFVVLGRQTHGISKSCSACCAPSLSIQAPGQGNTSYPHIAYPPDTETPAAARQTQRSPQVSVPRAQVPKEAQSL